MPGRRKILTVLISAAFAWPVLAQSGRDGVQLKYLGTADWEITDGSTVVLVDPYLSRLRRVTPNDTADPADNRPLFNLNLGEDGLLSRKEQIRGVRSHEQLRHLL
jgi:hypothetical protein